MNSDLSGPTDWILRYIKTTFFYVGYKSNSRNKFSEISSLTMTGTFSHNDSLINILYLADKHPVCIPKVEPNTIVE